MFSLVVVGVLLISLIVTFAQLYTTGEKISALNLNGTCPDFKPMTAMEGLKFDGEWLSVYAVNKGLQKTASIKCIKTTITFNPDRTIDLLMSAVKDSQEKSINVHAVPIPGQGLKYTLETDKAEASQHQNISQIGTLLAATDTYMIDVICATDETNHTYMATVHSRQPTLDAVSLEKVKEDLKAANIHDEPKATEGC